MNEITFTFWEARSRLNRSRILQVDTRVKAFDEIYNICIRLHRSDLNNSAKNASNPLCYFKDELSLLKNKCAKQVWRCVR